MITIILTLVIFIGILVVVYALLYNNLQAYNIKINEAESVIDELLRKKYDLTGNIITFIDKKVKLDKKTFDDYGKIKNVNMSSFDLERRLNDITKLIDQITLDHQKDLKSEEETNYLEDIYQINERLEAAKSYYNKYTTLLNKLIKKFPSNLIASFHGIKLRNYFDGKDMFDDEIKDFKL